jgi:hypothetical protein
MDTITLEQLYYIGELVAVMAVIASLLYVGKQIKQNAEAMRVNAASSVTQRVSYYTSSLLNNREAAECWARGGVDFDSLDDVDKQRLILFEAGILGNWHLTFKLREQGLISDWIWEDQLFAFEHFGRRKSVRAAWIIARDGFDKPFQDVMRQYLE